MSCGDADARDGRTDDPAALRIMLGHSETGARRTPLSMPESRRFRVGVSEDIVGLIVHDAINPHLHPIVNGVVWVED